VGCFVGGDISGKSEDARGRPAKAVQGASFSALAGGEELGAVAEDRGAGMQPEWLRWPCRQ